MLSIRNLSKSFGQQQIIKDLNMSVPEGSVFGFIGQNGAGKTTTMKRLDSDKVLFSFARGRERCDRNGHAVFLRPGVDFATIGSEIKGISTSSTKLK